MVHGPTTSSAEKSSTACSFGSMEQYFGPPRPGLAHAPDAPGSAAAALRAEVASRIGLLWPQHEDVETTVCLRTNGRTDGRADGWMDGLLAAVFGYFQRLLAGQSFLYHSCWPARAINYFYHLRLYHSQRWPG